MKTGFPPGRPIDKSTTISFKPFCVFTGRTRKYAEQSIKLMKPARSKKEIEKIRQAILEQALDIIVEQGLESLTMRSLAGRLEMTAPNLYNFFSGKDEIYLSLVVKGFEMLYGTLEAAATNAGTPADRARSM